MLALLFCHRLLLKQLVTMEVIQWMTLWNTFKDEFENEKNMLGGSLGNRAAEDLRQRVIKHVIFHSCSIIYFNYMLQWFIYKTLLFLVEHPCCLIVLLKDYLGETCWAALSHCSGMPILNCGLVIIKCL